jgi:hypothetical protein
VRSQLSIFPIQPDSLFWCFTRDGDADVRRVFNRHYSRRHYADGRAPKLFMGPGEKMVLVTPDASAIFGWRKFKDDSGQVGINCAFFRNEGGGLSSELIRDAMTLAWDRWPGERLYTYVNSRRIRSTNPGTCFMKAGWRRCGTTKGGLVILECEPSQFTQQEGTRP